MKNPPPGVKLVMAAVCVMKDIKADKINDPDKPGQKILDFWGPSKKLLNDMSFLANLKSYDRDNIPVSITGSCKGYSFFKGCNLYYKWYNFYIFYISLIQVHVLINCCT